jgi:ABC-type transporter Mla MlaB component
MLRITIHDNQELLCFQLEGRLAGPWLQELETCWQSTLNQQRRPILRVDLTGVTFIDDAGKACLATMYRQGAELVAADCLTRAIVAEIIQASLPEDSKRTTTSWPLPPHSHDLTSETGVQP